MPVRFILRKSTFVVSALLLFCCMGEGGVRLAGFGDFPTYELDADFGYIPAKKQSGRFMNANQWVFNDRNMGVGNHWRPGLAGNVLLLGNSIVLGGNPVNQRQKLGPLLQQLLGTGFHIWPIAAGGWTDTNIDEFLLKNPDLLDGTAITVFEYMKGGFGKAAPWPGEYICPTHHPNILSLYLARKYLVEPLLGHRSSAFGVLPPSESNTAENIQTFSHIVRSLKTSGKRVIVFSYPTLLDMTDANKAFVSESDRLSKLCVQLSIQCFDLGRWPDWGPQFYRADGVHPTEQGNIKIAEFLGAIIKMENP